MKFPAKIVASALALVLSGCVLPFHKKQPPPPPVLAPPVQTNTSRMPPTEPPPTNVTIPDKPVVNLTKLPAQSPPKPPPKHRRQPTPPAETQQAAAAEPAVSAIGQLSSGDPADARRQTESSLADTEKRLNGLNRQLNDQEKKTADHIREFIKQARAALASGDVDGASTLAAKAKVLLAELTH